MGQGGQHACQGSSMQCMALQYTERTRIPPQARARNCPAQYGSVPLRHACRACRGAVLRITLLAAGFIIGEPSLGCCSSAAHLLLLRLSLGRSYARPWGDAAQ